MQEHYSEIIPRLFVSYAQTIPLNEVVEEPGNIKKSKTTLMAADRAMVEFRKLATQYGSKKQWAVFTVALLALLRMNPERRHAEIREVMSLTTEMELEEWFIQAELEPRKKRLRTGYKSNGGERESA